MISIKLNKELDYEVYGDFKDFKIGGVNFGEKIRKNHPEINADNYREYIDNFYLTNQNLLEKNCQEINNDLNQKQQKFFTELKNIFGLDISKKEYLGYLSIFNCNPRYIEKGTFQIFYKKDLLDKIEVAFHESLHFAFFDYCDQFIEETKSLSKNSGPLWELSEIFNVIVLNLPQFQEILQRPEQPFYPELKEKLEIVQNVWDKNHDNLKNFIMEILKINHVANKDF
ncbi:MAG: hypothetical protein WCW56_01470 [Candidatus Paceibacterota bacterium]|jgi:hypothetical protein